MMVWRRYFVGVAVGFATCLAVSTVMAVSAAGAAMQSSHNVGLIPGNTPVPGKGPNGIMPISSYVSGLPSESFDKFRFASIGLSQITPGTLAKYDTVALIQVRTSSLTAAARSALAGFVAGGGKLLIHDADQTSGNDYSWLLPGSYTTQVGASCNGCGAASGTAQVTEGTGLISANSGDPAYVSFAELTKYTDALGDANLLVSDDPRWFAAAKGTNGHNDSGTQLAYATYNNGLIVYNGFDTDLVKTLPTDPWRCLGYTNYLCPANNHPSVDWLAEMWYSELNMSWGSSSSTSGLPQSTPVAGVGTQVAPSQAGLPSVQACVARRRLFLRLTTLGGTRHRVVQVDVDVNGRRVLRERGRLHNVTLTHLPKRGYYSVKIVATTARRYHLISKTRYRAC
jgi:hypothetical protein